MLYSVVQLLVRYIVQCVKNRRTRQDEDGAINVPVLAAETTTSVSWCLFASAMI